jgi:hypothetical protein
MTRKYAVLCALGLLTLSAGAVAWSGKGTTEPGIEADRTSGFMQLEPDTSPDQGVRKVYFNGFSSTGAVAVTTAVSANVALIGSQLQLPSAATYVMLGVWKDCNDDGFIGSGEESWRYPTLMLNDAGICPVSTTFPTHNDGSWVYEWHPITWKNASLVACCDINSFSDNKAAVWMDAGLPTDVFPLPACLTAPPRFYNQTGAMLAAADCQTGYAGTGLANTIGGGLEFDDQPMGKQGESSSLLNQYIPTGDDTDGSYATAFDCNQRTHVFSHNQTNPLGPREPTPYTVEGVVTGRLPGWSGWIANVSVDHSEPAPTVGTDGSLWGTTDKNERSVGDCDPSDGSFTEANHDCLAVCESTAYTRYRGRTQPSMTLYSEQWPENYTNNPVTQIQGENGHFLGGTSIRQFWLGGFLR